MLAPEILSQAHISVGDEVFVTVQKGQVIIKPANQVHDS
jgi:quercetin dioxygenase-like cupin family protein